MGDTADGYPGVKGIGEKTALKLIQNYHSVRGVLQSIHELPKGQQNKINDARKALDISLQLAEIHTEVPLNIDEIVSHMPYIGDNNVLMDVCTEYELNSVYRFINTI